MPRQRPLPQALARAGLVLATALAAASMPAAAQTGGPGGGIAPTAGSQLVVRAAGSPAAGGWPVIEVRVDGTTVGRTEVRSTEPVDFVFTTPALRSGSRVDVVFTNDATSAGQDRNLYVHLLSDGRSSVLPTLPGAVIDRGSGAKAFDGQDLVPGQGGIYWSGALRLTWPAPAVSDPALRARRAEAARFLLQATFGPTPAEIDALASSSPAQWINRQMAIPHRAHYVDHVQARFALGDEFRPGGGKYTDAWVGERFWALAATAEDQLRQRVGFALHHVFMASQADSNLWKHSRAYARYLDLLNQHAFGNFRSLLDEMALSPVMGIYLSHLRNRKEDPASGRLPDENFARELMQLFTIGLHELNPDGTPRLDARGQPVETYGNADVMALAKVFTGWAWAFPDNQLTDNRFRWGNPDYSAAGDSGIDLKKMRAYPGQHSQAEVVLFAGKPQAVVIPGSATPERRLQLALDALFLHPNVGPFIGRQLIQQLVTSAPSPAYVARVAAAFANNGRGVRGDMAAVVRAVLLDPEARGAPAAGFGKLREPVLRVTQWMRAFGATSVSGQYTMAWELEPLAQRVLRAPSVFGWFRPGHVPPGTDFATRGATAPEFQLVNESTTAAWVNRVEAMVGWGLGWNGNSTDVSATLAAQAQLAAAGNLEALVQNLDVLLFAGRMSPALRQDLLDAIAGVGGTDANSHTQRARIAVYVAMSSPEFLAQR